MGQGWRLLNMENKEDLFEPLKGNVEEIIQIIELSSFDEIIFGKTMRGYYAKIHASIDAEGYNRLVYFIFNNIGERIIAKDLEDRVAFTMEENENVKQLIIGKTYKVTVERYRPAQADGYALLEI